MTEKRGRAGKRKNREEKNKIESNPAMKFVLQRRGREQVDKRIKLKIKLTLELFYRGQAEKFNPRKKIEGMMERMRQEDKMISFSIGDEEEEVGESGTEDKIFHKRFMVTGYPKRESDS